VPPTKAARVATKYGWQAAIVSAAASAVIGVLVWFVVKPDRPLVKKGNPLMGRKKW